MPTIAYLGPEHTNTHLAARKRFGRRAKYVHAPTVEDVFRLVEREEADAGVVPVENSLEGAVTHTLDRFIDFRRSPVNIVGEMEFPIQHYLITNPGVELRMIGIVYSHPQALGQCRKWLQAHLPNLRGLVELSSTAEAVERVVSLKEENPLAAKGSAAIGSCEGARKHQLKTLPIPDSREDKTRFLIISLSKPRRTKRNKTSVLFALKDRPGALYDALTPFKRERINLTKIESRPSKKRAWEYCFFIDLEGHVAEPRVKRALARLESDVEFCNILGSYPVTR